MVSVAKTLGHSGPHLDIAVVIMAREIDNLKSESVSF